MEDVTVLPKVDAVMADYNGEDVSNNVMIPSVSVDETKGQISEDGSRIGAAMNDEELGVESTCRADDKVAECGTPITRSASCRTARKKRSAFGLFRVVFLSFSRSDSMKKTDDAASPRKKAGQGNDVDSKTPGASWKSIVDGMRPLRLPGQDLEYYPPPPPPLEPADMYHDVLLAPPSPAWSGSEAGMTSRYASAQDLHLLDRGEQQVDEEDATAVEAADGGRCPHAIDMQAEEFIAKFYEQCRLQKSESFNGRVTE